MKIKGNKERLWLGIALVAFILWLLLTMRSSAAAYPNYAKKLEPNFYSISTLNSEKFRKTHTGGYTIRRENTYAKGHCTFYIRASLPWMPDKWGNADGWDDRARERGFTVSKTPTRGAVAQSGRGDFGHVAVVTEVMSNNRVRVSEMNWNEVGVVTSRVTSKHYWVYITP